jgi:hypothetical protein
MRWTLLASRVWGRNPKDPKTIVESGTDPHTVCRCERSEDAARILKILGDLLKLQEFANTADDKIAILTSQRNALLNAVEIAGFRLSLRSGVTLEIVPDDGGPDGRNFVILRNLPKEKGKNGQELEGTE